MARKKKQECPSIPGWLVSFGDLMSLLLTFFILLYAMSTVDVTKALKFLSYFQGEPKYKPLRISVVQPIVPFSTDVIKKIKRRIKRLLPNSAYQISTTTKYVIVRLFNDVIFPGNGYKLTSAARGALEEVAFILNDLQNRDKFIIKVQGHAFINKELPLTAGVQDVWDLSVKRAEAVAFFLMQKGVNSSLFFISGYGDTKPLYTWNNPLLKRRNNRVEILIEVERRLSS